MSKNPNVISKITMNKNDWMFHAKDENNVRDDLFYVLTDARTEDVKTYVVPSSVVAAVLSVDHQTWLGGLSKSGKERKDNDIRVIMADGPRSEWLKRYQDAWHYLGGVCRFCFQEIDGPAAVVFDQPAHPFCGPQG